MNVGIQKTMKSWFLRINDLFERPDEIFAKKIFSDWKAEVMEMVLIKRSLEKQLIWRISVTKLILDLIQGIINKSTWGPRRPRLLIGPFSGPGQR